MEEKGFMGIFKIHREIPMGFSWPFNGSIPMGLRLSMESLT